MGWKTDFVRVLQRFANKLANILTAIPRGERTTRVVAFNKAEGEGGGLEKKVVSRMF